MKSCDFLYVPPGLAKNPYRPGVGTRPPYLAGRDEQLQRFHRIIEDYPEKRNNLRMTGLRGVGKTVLLKEFERISRREGWAVVRRDLSPRLCSETRLRGRDVRLPSRWRRTALGRGQDQEPDG